MTTRAPDLRDLLEGNGDRALGAKLERLAKVLRGSRIWLVGGAVRDLLIGRRTRDIDLVALDPLETLVAPIRSGMNSVSDGAHPAFLNHTFELADGFRLDLGRARDETYRAPGALPEVSPAGLGEDLARRDYTVNAMAVPLDRRDGALVDPHDGRDDLKAGLLRVLHPGSFRDDPTRIVRGMRLGALLELRFEPRTQQLAAAAVTKGAFGTLSESRRAAALELLLQNPQLARRAFSSEVGRRFATAIHPQLSYDDAIERRLRRLEQAAGDRWADLNTDERWLPALLALVWELPAAAIEESLARVAIAADKRIRLMRLRATVQEGVEHLSEVDSTRYERFCHLDRMGPIGRLLVYAEGGSRAGKWLHESWLPFAKLELGIAGSDLLASGFVPGPAIGKALAAVRRARINGEIGEQEELGFARAWLEKES